jgi:hypothetical protein
LLVLLFVEPVGERRGGRLVDDAQDFESGNLAGVLRRLPLRVVEVGRDRDDGLRDRLAKVVLGGNGFCCPSIWMATRSPSRATRYGTIFISSDTSSKRRPMNRLIENTVFSGFVTAWRFATCPTSRSPPFVKATTDGVRRPPSELVMTTGSPPSMTATTELVVPRSIPIILLMTSPRTRWLREILVS